MLRYETLSHLDQRMIRLAVAERDPVACAWVHAFTGVKRLLAASLIWQLRK